MFPVCSRPRTLLLLLLAGLLLTGSCKENPSRPPSGLGMFESGKFDEDEVAALIEKTVQPTDSGSYSIGVQRYRTYQNNDHFPVWLQEDGKTGQAAQLLAELDSLRWDGLNPERYRLTTLREQLARFQAAKTLTAEEVMALDTGLTSSYFSASRDLLLGMVAPPLADSLWFHPNDSIWHTDEAIAQLKQGGYLSLDSFRSRLPVYASIRKAYRHYRLLRADTIYQKLKAKAEQLQGMPDSLLVALIRAETPWLPRPVNDTLVTERKTWIFAYQQYYGLRRTAKADSAFRATLLQDPEDPAEKLRVNLERLRWLPRQLDSLYLLVNIPTMELVLHRNGFDAVRMNVVVGKASRQTPALRASMANIVFNPPWGVPPTILKKDVIPGMTKAGVEYLRRKGLKVYDHNGNMVDPSTVNASNYKRYVFRQPPGEDNALGYVKFNLPNKWDIYLHDTPHREDFDKWDRARSSGCIRVARPKELAEIILSDLEGRRYDEPRIDSVIQTQKTRWEVLKNRIPVHIVYLTATEDGTGTGIRLGRDFYRRDQKLREALGR